MPEQEKEQLRPEIQTLPERIPERAPVRSQGTDRLDCPGEQEPESQTGQRSVSPDPFCYFSDARVLNRSFLPSTDCRADPVQDSRYPLYRPF